MPPTVLHRIPFAGLALLAAVVLPPSSLQAGSYEDVQEYIEKEQVHVVRVEEHWKVRVEYPDPDRGTPEFVFVLTPTGHFEGPHMVFQLNHISEPNYSRGGVQLIAYHGSSATDFTSKLRGRQLYEIGDSVEVRMAISLTEVQQSSALKYEVFKLKGKVWGDNKAPEWMAVTQPTTLKNLNHYDPAKTHLWTGASFGVHTLKYVEIQKVVYVFSDGKTIDVGEAKTKSEYQPSVQYKSFDEYKGSLRKYEQN